MDVILGMLGNLWGLMAGFGFVLTIGCGIWSGVQFMLAQGDPQKVTQARLDFVGVVVPDDDRGRLRGASGHPGRGSGRQPAGQD